MTDSNAHDSQVIDNLLYEDDKWEGFYANTAYTVQNR